MSRRFVLISTAVVVLLLLAALPAHADVPIAHIFLFHSETCTSCQAVLEEVLPSLLAKYGAQLEIRYFDIGITDNYEALLLLEERYDLPTRGIPQVFVGKFALVGESMIREHLDRLIAEGLEAGGLNYLDPELIPAATSVPLPTPAASLEPSPTTAATPAPTAVFSPDHTRLPEEGSKWCNPAPHSDKPIVYMAYFHDVACRECDRVVYDLNLLHSRYSNLCILSFDLNEDAALSEGLGERYGVPPEKRLVAPSVFVGEHYLVTPDINMETLTALVEQYVTSGSKPPWEAVADEQATQSIIERFGSFSALTVIGAGLIDGINPCAFAGIIFFVSYLAVTKRKGKDILVVGAAFTVGIFLSYLLIGLGIFGFVRRLSFIRTFSHIVYIATMVLCAVLALLSLYDYVQIRRGKKEDVTLRLPRVLQARMRTTIRQSSRVQSFVRAAFVTGFLISFLEFACTGQVYLPTIVFVTGVPELRAHAVAYLVLYNLLFVSPLVVIFLLTYLGTTWQQLNRFLESNMATIKLLTAGLFALLAVWLAAYVFGEV